MIFALLKRLLFTGVIVVISSGMGCSSQKCADANSEWAKSRDRWQSKGIVDYDMIVERFQGGLYSFVPFSIKVRDGRVVSKGPARANLGLEHTDDYEQVETVDKMFDTIRNGCENRTEMRVEYDPKTGIPHFIGFTGDSYAADAGYYYRVEKFVPFDKSEP